MLTTTGKDMFIQNKLIDGYKFINALKQPNIIEKMVFYCRYIFVRKYSHIKITNNKLFILSEIRHRERNESVYKYILCVLKKYKVGDLECVILIDDFPGEHGKQFPFLQFSKYDDSNGFLIPCWTFMLDSGMRHLACNWKQWLDHCTQIRPFFDNKEKINKIYFRGHKQPSSNRLAFMNSSSEYLDIKSDQDWRPITDVCKYKYCIALPGAYSQESGWSGRFKFLLSLGTPCFFWNTFAREFYYYLLKPNVHFIPVPESLKFISDNDTQEVDEYVNEFFSQTNNHSEIGDNAFKFAQETLSFENIIEYTYHTLNFISEIQKSN